MDPLELQAAKASIKGALEWTASNILIDVKSSISQEQTTFDLASIIQKANGNGGGRNASQTDMLMHKCHFIPQDVFQGSSNEKESKKRMTGYLENACRGAGFSIVAGNTRSTKNGRIKRHVYHCPRYKHKKDSNVTESKRQRNRKSSRPTMDEPTCPFKFTVCQDTKTGVYFFPRCVSGNLNHVGHFKLAPEHLPVSMKALAAKEIDNILDQLSLHFTPSAINRLLKLRSGIQLSRDQLAKLKQFGTQLTLDLGSPAAQLLAKLKSDNNVEFVIQTGSLSEVGCIRIRNYSNIDIAALTSADSQTGVKVTFGPPSPKEAFVKAVLEALKIQQGAKILLCVAWVTKDQLAYFNKFPHLVVMDVTFGTNRERRPLMKATSVHSRNKNLPLFNCFMAADAGWVWDWILSHAFPVLLGKASCAKVQMIVTDQDVKCFSHIDAQIISGVFPSGKHRLCAWHKVDQGYITGAGKFRYIPEQKELVEGAISFFWAFIEAVESEAEMNHLKEQFLAWVDHKCSTSSNISAQCKGHVLNFFNNKFWNVRTRLFQCYFQSQEGGSQVTSMPVEQEFSRMKRSPFGTRANLSIHNSQDAIQQVDDQALLDVARGDFQSLSQTHGGSLGGIEEELTRDLNKRCSDMLQLQHVASAEFLACRRADGEYLVRQENPKLSNSVIKEGNCYPGSHVVPQFWRTRIVTIKDGRAKCSCKLFERNGWTCRHIFAVTALEPSSNLCSPKHIKEYAIFYGEEHNFTSIVDKSLAKCHLGVPVSMDLRLPSEVDSMNSLEWFEKGLDVCLTPQSPNYVLRHTNHLPGDLVPGIRITGRDATPARSATESPGHFSVHNSPQTPFPSTSPAQQCDISTPNGPLGKINPHVELSQITSSIARSVYDMRTYDIARNGLLEVLKQTQAAIPGAHTKHSSSLLRSFPAVEKRSTVPRKRTKAQEERDKIKRKGRKLLFKSNT